MGNKKVINALIKQYGLQQKSHWLFDNEPSLEKVLYNLLNFVTFHFKGEELPLFDECLINAFSRINEKKPLTHNVKAFLQDIVEKAYLLLERRIVVETINGSVAWIPMQEPISIFLQRYEGVTPTMVDEKNDFVTVSNREASLMLAVHIMPAHAVSMAVESVCEAYKVE